MITGSLVARAVALVSLDGVAPRFITPERMPNLCALARAGAACFTARTVVPPLTRPAHASMLRGVGPEVHGAADNSRAGIDTDAPSVLAVARHAGRTTAAVTNWAPLDLLLEPDAAVHRVAIDGGYDPAEDDLAVDLTASLVRRARPDLMFVYLCRPDLSGHAHGWGSDEYLAALTLVDDTFGRLLGALGADYDVVVTTDHGGVGDHHERLTADVLDTFVVARSSRIAAGSMWPKASMLDIAPTVADLAGLDAHPRWNGRSLLGSERPMVDELLDLLRESDRHTYGERVTMLDHALQTAAAAEVVGADDELIVAALLHDLGHVRGVAGEHGDPDHAAIGATFLRPWFPATVTEPIRLHVAAKRHLVATDPQYAAELSEASRITLEQQGGPFDDSGAAEFAAQPHSARAIVLRRCDDAGKVAGVRRAPLESYRDRLARTLAAGPIDPSWARDACRCPVCRDAASDQHLIDVHELAGWSVLGSWATGDRVHVSLARGPETHIATIPLAPRPGPIRATPWAGRPALAGRRPDDVAGICTDVIEHGVALVAGLAATEGEVLRFAGTLGFVRETNYGRLFDVRTEPAAGNLAYTALTLPLHTDNPYRDPVPTVQILHCLRPATVGGATRLADGFAASEMLRRDDPGAFWRLANTPVTFRFHDDTVDLVAERTPIELDGHGDVRAVALNHRSLDTPVEAELAHAMQAFADRLEEIALELVLAEGEAIVFDNRRILHARTGFDADAGRHLQGCYVDIDALGSIARRA